MPEKFEKKRSIFGPHAHAMISLWTDHRKTHSKFLFQNVPTSQWSHMNRRRNISYFCVKKPLARDVHESLRDFANIPA